MYVCVACVWMIAFDFVLARKCLELWAAIDSQQQEQYWSWFVLQTKIGVFILMDFTSFGYCKLLYDITAGVSLYVHM